MLRKRVIPIVLLDGFSVLKTIQFSQRRNLGSPVTIIRTYNTRNVDELVLLDIDASRQRRAIDRFTIQDLAQECFMPLTVGGGVRSLDDIELLLKNGADKVAINSYAIENPSFIAEASKVFGSQCIVVSIDVVERDGFFEIYSASGKEVSMALEYWLCEVEKQGAGEILINNVTLDGTMKGASVDLANLVSSRVKIPVIYAGGVSSPEDCAKIAETPVSAVGVSSIFHFTDATPQDCRNAMAECGIPVR